MCRLSYSQGSDSAACQRMATPDSGPRWAISRVESNGTTPWWTIWDGDRIVMGNWDPHIFRYVNLYLSSVIFDIDHQITVVKNSATFPKPRTRMKALSVTASSARHLRNRPLPSRLNCWRFTGNFVASALDSVSTPLDVHSAIFTT